MSITQFLGKNSDGGFGEKAVAKARAAGLSDAQIQQQVAAAGLSLGSKAAAALGGGSSPAPSGGGNGNGLAAYANPNTGGFGLKALERAQREGGFSDAQIQARLANSGLQIGDQVRQRYGIESNGLPKGKQASFVDAGSGAIYGTRGIATDTHGVVYAAGPMSAEAVRNFLAGKPESEWLLPASTNAPDQPYQAPSGTRYVQPIGMGQRPQFGSSVFGNASASAPPSVDYQQQLEAAKSSYESSLSSWRSQLDTAAKEKAAAEARANELESARRAETEIAVSQQLSSLRSGSTVSGSAGPGLGSLSSGRSSYSISTGGKSGGVLDRAYKDIDPTDSVLNKNVAVASVASATGSSGTSARTEARQRALASGGSASSYYSRRFG